MRKIILPAIVLCLITGCTQSAEKQTQDIEKPPSLPDNIEAEQEPSNVQEEALSAKEKSTG